MKKVILIVIGAIFALLIALFLVRAFSEKQIDDVSPEIECDEKLLEKADVFFVILRFNGKNISEEKEWTNRIKSAGKRLEMHGVYHLYHEFGSDRDKNYLNEGIEEFEKAFGVKPAGFKAPQMALSSENKKLISLEGMKIYGLFNQITHKVYHCNDSGMFPNKLINLF